MPLSVPIENIAAVNCYLSWSGVVLVVVFVCSMHA